jgi:hypothetical protein
MPTKLFEYLAHGLPVITQPSAVWTSTVEALQAGLVVRFQAPDIEADIGQRLHTTHFYPAGIPQEAFWATEATKLWRAVDSIQ